MAISSYKVYQAKYLIPQSDKGPAFTLPCNPIRYHVELIRNGKMVGFCTRSTEAEVISECEDHVRRGDGSQTD